MIRLSGADRCAVGLRVLGLAVSLGATSPAWAVPSFARQTGMACEACHTVFPELTHFGRLFKANAYTLDNLKQVRDIDAKKQELLSLSSLPPISAMIQISESWLNSPLAHQRTRKPVRPDCHSSSVSSMRAKWRRTWAP